MAEPSTGQPINTRKEQGVTHATVPWGSFLPFQPAHSGRTFDLDPLARPLAPANTEVVTA
jgi:hypothetical protein